MNKLFVFLASLGLSSVSQANCLRSVDSAQFITSKIRGFYVNREESEKHFVILDKATCSVSGSVVSVGENTRNHMYLSFKDSDKFLQSTLLASYAKGDTVRFRLGSISENGFFSSI